MTKMPTILDFQEQFPTDEACMEHIMRTRYGDRHDCEKCGRDAHFYRVKARTCYACEHCGHQVYPMAGTPFENTRTKLRLWFFVMFLFCASRNGVSAKEVQRQTGVTYKTAWRMCKLIRDYMGHVDGDGTLGGPGMPAVEADKAFIGGKDKMGKDDKAIVFGAVERGGEVVTKIVDDKRSLTGAKAVASTVRKGGRVYTDFGQEFSAVQAMGYKQERVNHKAQEYVRGSVHTNTIEAFWLLVKRGISGTYVWCSKRHLQSYLNEFEYRWNMRNHQHLMFEALISSFAPPLRRGRVASRAANAEIAYPGL
ncbi:MAG: IS1595 family transposase [Pseudomonadota bacterium]